MTDLVIGAEQPHVTLRVVPLAAGAHAGLRVPFVILVHVEKSRRGRRHLRRRARLQIPRRRRPDRPPARLDHLHHRPARRPIRLSPTTAAAPQAGWPRQSTVTPGVEEITQWLIPGAPIHSWTVSASANIEHPPAQFRGLVAKTPGHGPSRCEASRRNALARFQDLLGSSR